MVSVYHVSGENRRVNLNVGSCEIVSFFVGKLCGFMSVFSLISGAKRLNINNWMGDARQYQVLKDLKVTKPYKLGRIWARKLLFPFILK